MSCASAQHFEETVSFSVLGTSTSDPECEEQNTTGAIYLHRL